MNTPALRPARLKPHWPAGAALGVLLGLLASTHTQAQAFRTLYWDPNESGSGTGGTGTWQNGTTNLWNTAADGTGTPVSWDNASQDTAVFGGTAGAVTVSGGVTADKLTFTSGGYSLTGGTITIPVVSNVSKTVLAYTGGSGTVTIANNIDLNVSGATSANIHYNFNNATNSSLTLNGNISVTGGVGAKIISFNQLGTGTTTFGGSVVAVSGGTTSLAFGNLSADSADSATYILKGSNQLTNGTKAQIVKGTVLVENAGAFNTTGNVRVGSDLGGGGASGESAKLLTNAAITLANDISLDRGNAGLHRVVGGNTAQNSTFSGNMDFFAASNLTLEVTAVAGGRVDFSGRIYSSTTGTSNAVKKIGDGTVRFTRAAGNSYDGGTTISAGTLIVNNTSGSGLGTGAVTVQNGGTLGGTGFISGATTVNGSINPGDSGIGTLTIQNNVTWNGALSAGSATDWKFELGPTNTSDKLLITGDFDKGTGSIFRFDFLGSTALGTFVLVDWTASTDFVASNFTYTNLGAGNAASFAFNGSQLEVTVAAIPEPSVAFLIAFGLGLAGVSRRRIGRP